MHKYSSCLYLVFHILLHTLTQAIMHTYVTLEPQVERVASAASVEFGGVLEHRVDVFGIGYDASGRDDQDVKGTRTEESVHDKGVVRSGRSVDVEPLRVRPNVRRTSLAIRLERSIL